MVANTQNRAFSLVELLTVVAILVTLLALGVPTMSGGFRSTALMHGGNSLAGLSDLARQTALSRNVMTAVIMVTEGPNENLNARTLGLFELGADRVWKQTSQWVYLPESVFFQDDPATAANHAELPTAPSEMQVTLNGQPFTLSRGKYRALVFFPDGRMLGDSLHSRTVSVRNRGTAGDGSRPANYYDLVFNADNSAYRIVRP